MLFLVLLGPLFNVFGFVLEVSSAINMVVTSCKFFSIYLPQYIVYIPVLSR